MVSELGLEGRIIFGDMVNPNALIETQSHRRSNYHQIKASSFLRLNPDYLHYPYRERNDLLVQSSMRCRQRVH